MLPSLILDLLTRKEHYDTLLEEREIELDPWYIKEMTIFGANITVYVNDPSLGGEEKTYSNKDIYVLANTILKNHKPSLGHLSHILYQLGLAKYCDKTNRPYHYSDERCQAPLDDILPYWKMGFSNMFP